MPPEPPPMPSHYLPGKPIILSRLPAQDWFDLEEAATHSGWSRNFIRSRVESGELVAQKFQNRKNQATGGNYFSYRIHVDDLVFFILRNGNGRYTDEKAFRDVVTILRTWPAWMRREMVKFLNRSLTPSSPPEAGGHANGTACKAQESGTAAAPGGAAAINS